MRKSPAWYWSETPALSVGLDEVLAGSSVAYKVWSIRSIVISFGSNFGPGRTSVGLVGICNWSGLVLDMVQVDFFAIGGITNDLA